LTLGDRIREKRIKNGLSQKKLADLLGVHQTMIDHYESGRRVPTASMVVDLARELNCTTDYILLGTTRALS
jgi:transcriptional regulator with XRE-family HTH domain